MIQLFRVSFLKFQLHMAYYFSWFSLHLFSLCIKVDVVVFRKTEFVFFSFCIYYFIKFEVWVYVQKDNGFIPSDTAFWVLRVSFFQTFEFQLHATKYFSLWLSHLFLLHIRGCATRYCPNITAMGCRQCLLLVLSSWKVNIAKNPIAVMGL